MLKWGIGSYTLPWSIGVPGYHPPRNPLSAAGLLEQAREYGLSLVQYADNLPLDQLSEPQRDELFRQARRWGISIELGTRGTSPDALRRQLGIARRAGAAIVRTLITDADLAAAERHIREVLPDFANSGITLAIENHGLHTTDQLRGLFDRLASPFVGCCLDTVNSFGALETPDRVIRQLVPYIVNLHIKDFEIKRIDHQMGFIVTGTPAGAGRLDPELLLSELAAHGKAPTAVLELWTPFTRSADETALLEQEWCARSVAYLKQIFKTKRA